MNRGVIMDGDLALSPVYIVVSQTGTILSRILKQITRKDYNHASISLYDDLHIMYSFGRKNPYNPFYGGFVAESTSFGTFKRFSNTKVVVLRVLLTQNEYEDLSRMLSYMESHSKKYKYNYLGLCLAAFKICFTVRDRYYCSEFVRDILVKYNVDGADKLDRIVHPMSFLKIPQSETVFRGKLTDYEAPISQTV